MSEKSGITSFHVIETVGGVYLGANSIIAGYRSTILTHSLSLRTGDVSVDKVQIGQSTFVGTGSTLLQGVTIGDRVLIAGGAVVNRDLLESDSLCGGVPAKRIADYDMTNFDCRRARSM